MSESQKHRALLLDLAIEPDDKSTLVAYVNLLGIVSLGHTLEIKPTGRNLADHFEGSLTSRSGARKVNGDAPTVALLARELVHRWMGGTSPLQQRRDVDVAPISLALAREVFTMPQQQAEPEPPTRCPGCRSRKIRPAQQLGAWNCAACGCVFRPHAQPFEGVALCAAGAPGGRCDCTGCPECDSTSSAPCGLTLGRISGREGMVCLRCDAEQIEREVTR